MMKKLLTTSLIITILAAGNALAARVTGINLSHADGFTVAQIDVEGEVRHSHQTEIAKDGKPFRIIVDVLSATHDMGAMVFEGLPDCRITGIRTSQYSVDPEQIVRLVFDMKGETAYRIDTEQNSLKVYVSDPDAVQFPIWSSYDIVGGTVVSESLVASTETTNPESVDTAAPGDDAASLIASINKALDEDRISSLEPSSEPTSDITAESAGADSKQTPSETTQVFDTSKGPELTSSDSLTESTPKTAAQILEEINRETALALEGPKSDEPTTESAGGLSDSGSDLNQTSIDETSGLPDESVANPPSDGQSEPTSTPVSPETTAVSKPLPTEPAKSDDGTKGAGENVQKTLLPKAPNKTEPGKLAESGVETGTIMETGNDESSTARFRRDPSKSKRIRGTMVAEFPTRLVIKYKGNNYRDPFETLINETKTHNNPLEVRVPNVEGLRLVGILEAYATGNSALFEDKDGYGYILKAGDKVQKGYVLRVDNDRVYFQIFEYGWSRTVAMDMEIF
jgi:hypothetical protein